MLNLDKQYQSYIEKLSTVLNKYFAIVDEAFAVDCSQAFQGSILLAEYVGVPNENILKSISDIDDFFMN